VPANPQATPTLSHPSVIHVAPALAPSDEEDDLDSLIKFSPLAQQWFQDYTAMETEWNPYGNWKLNMSEVRYRCFWLAIFGSLRRALDLSPLRRSPC
jgi:hypothetical protein